MKAESAVLVIGDLHSGKKTASFDIAVLEERMKNMGNNVVKVLSILKPAYSIANLYILQTGDMIDNDSIYKTQKYHTDPQADYPWAQVKGLINIMEPVYRKLKDNTGLPIKIYGVRGNHGRVSRYTSESNNFDLMYYDYLQSKLEGVIDVYSSPKFAEVVEIQGHGVLIYHGAGIRMYQNLPHYGIVQRVMRWKQSLDAPFSIVCLGHFHTFGYYKWIGTEIFLSGTAVTDDEFAMEELGMDGEPTFWLFGVHPERGVTWRFPIPLI